jgi:hypothetical protein
MPPLPAVIMFSSSLIRLRVRQVEQSCIFDLSDRTGQELSATLPYEARLTDLYQNWQQIYRRRYELRSRAQVTRKGGSGTPSAYDWDQELRLAETALLQEFDRWLGQAALLEIREWIQRQISVVSHSASASTLKTPVEILLDCSPIDLARLPWEQWKLVRDAPFGQVRVARTCLNVVTPAPALPARRGKIRVLAIFADAPDLNHEPDLKALQQLRAVAEIEWVQCQSNSPDSNTSQAVVLKQQVAEAIADDRGWDVLFFAGHSEEAATTGGKLELAPNVSLSIVEIEPQLVQAQQRGLTLAIFNSCNGLHIANALLQLGFGQVLVMRERIQDAVAHQFLAQICQHLATYDDIHTALLKACRYLASEQLAYPSAALIPSLFRHPAPNLALFQIEPARWKRVWQAWRPTRWETIAFSTITLLSFLVPVREILMEQRYWAQAIYRHTTGQLPSPTQPPVTILSIDQDSIDLNHIDIYKVKPIDRTYLAKLVDRLHRLNVKVIGIDYLLDGSTNQDAILANTLQTAIQQHQTWFIFATVQNEAGQTIRVSQRLAQPQSMLLGNAEILDWQVMLPTHTPCQVACPFAYQLALAHTLNHSAPEGLPQPQLSTSVDLQNQLNSYLSKNAPSNPTLAFLHQPDFPPGLKPIIDFSLPPALTYQSIAAWDFLERPLDDPTLQQLQQQVVIIAAGGYDQADDNFSVPMAIDFWRNIDQRGWQEQPGSSLNQSLQVFTGGEAHAYAVHHLLAQHLVRPIPNLWLMLMAALLARGTSLFVLQQSKSQRQRIILLLIAANLLYSLLALQVYVVAMLLIPCFLPSVLFWSYILPSFKRS